MKRSILSRLILAVTGIFILSGVCAAAEFSADMIQTSQRALNKGKLYVKGGKVREEITAGRKQIVIVRQDKKLVWTCDPVAKTYMRVTGGVLRGLDDPRARERFKKIGVARPITKETVNGYLCEKRQWVSKGKPPTTLTEWVSRQLGFALKTEMKAPYATTVVEYKNIKVGKVSDSLFEIPKGYRAITAPSAPKPPTQGR